MYIRINKTAVVISYTNAEQKKDQTVYNTETQSEAYFSHRHRI